MIATMRHALAAVLVLAACGPIVTDEDDGTGGTGGTGDEPELWGFALSWPPEDLRPVAVVALDVDDWCARTRAEQVAAGGTAGECVRVEALWCGVRSGPCYLDAGACASWEASGCVRR